MDKNYDAKARLCREFIMSDPCRPAFHFAIPDGDGEPGDPNGAFFARGRYHLMYLYRNQSTEAFHWGHISSADLLHWRSHPDALTNDGGDEGCFSGGAFVDDDETAYLTFWKFPSKNFTKDNGGIAIACSRPPYDVWERPEPIAIESSREVWGAFDLTVEGGVRHIGCADPSNIWKKDGWYYMQTGSKVVLDTYGRDENAASEYRGDWVELFKSRDLKSWSYVHRFYRNPRTDPSWPDETEDDMCPSFLPLPDSKADGRLTDLWLQLFISHNKGAQYYIGRLEGETFVPLQHGRFSWVDNTFFAPEALIDGRNRQIFWSWLLDNRRDEYRRFGWTGVYNFPRVLWYADGCLHMAPADELDALQHDPRSFDIGVTDSAPIEIEDSRTFRIRAEIDMNGAAQAGFVVREDAARAELTRIYYDGARKELVMDATRSGSDGRCVCERAPFTLEDGEKLSLDIIVDHAVIEVYANERQAICHRVYPTDIGAAAGVRAVSDGANFGKVKTWLINPTNFF